ncbi:MAG: DUF732 domain-containing protein [Mycobacterium sp.]|nr:DUF732 domain-containing protein [Mycobacterium sp.]
MTLRRIALAAGLMAGALAFAAPAQADPDLLTDVLSTLDSSETVALGQSLCPLLAARSQNTADIVAKVAESVGRPIGLAPLFAGAAVSNLCPRVIGELAG